MTLKESYIQAKNDELFLLDKCRSENDKYYYVGAFKNVNQIFACYQIFEEHNFSKPKNHFYKISKIYSYLHFKYDNGKHTSNNIFTTHHSICYAVCSDCENITGNYLAYEDDFWKTFPKSFFYAVKSILKDDYTELSKQIDLLKSYTSRKSWEKNYFGVVNGFKGLLQKDKLLIEQGINEILDLHKKQQHQAVIKDYLNIEALTLAKLAYRKGIVIEINNPLLPMEIIPLNKPDTYEEYDFFKEMPPSLHRVKRSNSMELEIRVSTKHRTRQIQRFRFVETRTEAWKFATGSEARPCGERSSRKYFQTLNEF